MALILPRSAMIHIPKTGGTWCRAAISAANIPTFESGPPGVTKLNQAHGSLKQTYATIMMVNWRKNKTQRRRLTFSFVRHPCTWLESTWADALQHGKLPGYAAKTPAEKRFWEHCESLDNPWAQELHREHPQPYRGLNPGEERFWFHQCHSYSFEKFIDNVLKIKPDVPSRAMLTRIGYEKVSNGTWRPEEHTVDFVGHTETLVDDLIRVLTLAGEKFDERVIRGVAPKRVSGRLPKYKHKMVWRPGQREAIYKANQQLFDGFGYEP
jgi:hypothetical protein